MVETGKDLRLPREPGEPLWVSREGVGEDLQRDLPVELRVGGLPDLPHPALAQEGGDVVVAEAGAGGQGHVGLESGPLYRDSGLDWNAGVAGQFSASAAPPAALGAPVSGS